VQEISDFFSRTDQPDVAPQISTAPASCQLKVIPKQFLLSNKSPPARSGVRKSLSMISGNEPGARAFTITGLGVAARSEECIPVSVVQQYHPVPRKVSPIWCNQCRFTTSYYPCSAASSPKRALHAGVRGTFWSSSMCCKRTDLRATAAQPTEDGYC
jgi:hypothetical protein